MSFNFKWPTFSEEFHKSAAQMLDSALNKGPKPKVIADDIKVKELGMGTIPPELEILEIGDLGTDRFRGIFRLTYAGDAHLVLSTKVQANPLTKPNRPDIGLFPSSTASRGILFAAAPLIVPMHLRLSSVKLRAIVVLVVSKAKGITLVFKNDPLESVEVSSTFDSVAVIQKYLQQEIEGQLREMFREDLPGIIHRLSQRWLSGEAKQEREEQQSKESNPNLREAPFPRSTSDPQASFDASASQPRSRSRPRRSTSGTAASISRSPPSSPPKPRNAGSRKSRHTAKSASTSAALLGNELETARSASSLFSTPMTNFESSFPDIENYDPTYGLRPDELPTHSGYSGLGKLANRVSAGLRDLTASAQEAGSLGLCALLGSQPAPLPAKEEAEDDFALESYDEEEEDEEEEDEEEDEDVIDEDEDEEDEDDDEDVDQQEETMDDVPDLDLGNEADISLDYTRFGYPPASAAFSDTALENITRAGSIIFEDSAPLSARKPRRPSTGKSASVAGGARAGSSKGSEFGARSVASTGVGRRRKSRRRSRIEYETIPAVGGGTVTRPRVYHTTSKVRAPDVDWDDDLDRDGKLGATAGSNRTGGATMNGSEISASAGSTTMGAESSRTATVRLGGLRGDGSDENDAEVDYPVEHGRRYVGNDPYERGHSASSSASASARYSSGQNSSGYGGGPGWRGRNGFTRDHYGRVYQRWDASGSSTAPTSYPSTGQGSASDLGSRLSPQSPAKTDAGESTSSGIRLSKGKGAARPRPHASGSMGRPSFVQPQGSRPEAGISPSRTLLRPQPIPVQRPADATPSGSPGGNELELGGTSPLSRQDLVSTSPFRGASFPGSSPQAHQSPTFRSGGHGGLSSSPSTSLSLDASAHFADLVKSNHTLSPFTRNMEHFTVRSAPVTPGISPGLAAGWPGLGGMSSGPGSSAASGTGSGASGNQLAHHHQHGYGRIRTPNSGPGSFVGGNAAVVAPSSGLRVSTVSASDSAATFASSSSTFGTPVQARRRRTFQLGGSGSGGNSEGNRGNSGHDKKSEGGHPAVDVSPAKSRRSHTSSSRLTFTSDDHSMNQDRGSLSPEEEIDANPSAHRRRLQRSLSGRTSSSGQSERIQQKPNYGFSQFAGSAPLGFSSASSFGRANGSSSGNEWETEEKERIFGNRSQQRRARPDSMGPPSEAARVGASRWEAIRE